jgi:heme exporter protein CcmD
MSWEHVTALPALDGHGGYVWGAYGLALLAVLLEGWLVARRRRRAVGLVAQLMDGEGAR